MARVGRERSPPVRNLARRRRRPVPAAVPELGGIHGKCIHEALGQRHAVGSVPLPAQHPFGRRTLTGSLRRGALVGVRLLQEAPPPRGVSGRGERRQFRNGPQDADSNDSPNVAILGDLVI